MLDDTADALTGTYEGIGEGWFAPVTDTVARVAGRPSIPFTQFIRELQKVGFKDGAIVERGQMLFVIDPRPYEALAAQAGGQLAEARSRVNLGERELERGQQLAQTRAVATSQVDQRRQTLQVAQAAIVQAEANLRAAQLNVEFARARTQAPHPASAIGPFR